MLTIKKTIMNKHFNFLPEKFAFDVPTLIGIVIGEVVFFKLDSIGGEETYEELQNLSLDKLSLNLQKSFEYVKPKDRNGYIHGMSNEEVSLDNIFFLKRENFINKFKDSVRSLNECLDVVALEQNVFKKLKEEVTT